MPDVFDDTKQYIQVTNVNAGQFSYQHPTDKLSMPENAGAELLNIEIDEVGKRKKRTGYELIGDDLGANAFVGLVGYSPVGGSKSLLGESNGTVYIWTGSGNWASSKTGLTASDFTDFVVAGGLAFRLNQTDNIWSFNGTAWTDEGSGGAASGNPPSGKIGLWTSNQRFLLGNTTDNPNWIWMSDAGAPQTFGDAPFKFGDRDSTGVTGMWEFTDGEVIVTSKNGLYVWAISDTTTSNWTVKKISDVGCVAQGSMKQIGPDLVFLSRDGVRSVVQSAQDKKRGDSLPLSYPITDWINRINWNKAYLSRAWVWNDNYFLAVPIDSSSYNNYVLSFNRRAFSNNGNKGGWTVFENYPAGCWAEQDFSGIRRLYFGNASADTTAFMAKSDRPSDHVFNDNGTAIMFRETGKRYDFGVSNIDKTFSEMEVELIEEDIGSIKVEAQIDGEGWTTLNQSPIDQNVDLPALPIDLPFDLSGGNKVRKKLFLEGLGRGRNIQIRLTEETNDAECQILDYTISAFVENVEFE